jgi:hypothetical protein
MVRLVTNQRAFSSAAPRVKTDASGQTVVKRGVVAPEFDPAEVGTPLGAGYETNAVVQVFDAEGSLVATELGAFPAVSKSHAESQAVSALRLRLRGHDLRGGRLVAAVDQNPCTNCSAELGSFADSLELETYEVWGPSRESLSMPGVSVTPKTAARTASMGGSRPAVKPTLLEGATLPANRAPGIPAESPVLPVTPIQGGTTIRQAATEAAEVPRVPEKPLTVPRVKPAGRVSLSGALSKAAGVANVVLGAAAALSNADEFENAFEGRVEIEIPGQKAAEYEVGYEFEIDLGKDEAGIEFFAKVRVGTNVVGRKRFYVVSVYTLA